MDIAGRAFRRRSTPCFYDRERLAAPRGSRRDSRWWNISRTEPSRHSFYFFAGAAFVRLKGKGLNLSKAIYPYFLGQMVFAPVLAFEKQLNFAMQTVICRRKA